MTEGVEGDYIRNDVLLPFFTSFWVVRNALDRRNARQVVETTVELAKKVTQRFPRLSVSLLCFSDLKLSLLIGGGSGCYSTHCSPSEGYVGALPAYDA